MQFREADVAFSVQLSYCWLQLLRSFSSNCGATPYPGASAKPLLEVPGREAPSDVKIPMSTC